VERSLGEVERESLKSWLAQFSAHIHLPRAYQVNQFKVRPPDHHEVKPQGILPKAENVGAQIEQENGQYDQLVGQDDHDQIINETGDNEKALLLDPHTKVAAEDVSKVDGTWKGGNGRASLTLRNETQLTGNWIAGRREGWGSSKGKWLEKQGILLLRAVYSGGRIEGSVMMTTEDGLELEGRCRDGCLEGVLVGRQSGGDQLLVAAYHKGRPVGKAWRRG